jgi:uncharacterized protein with PQ loop repeat
MTLISCLNAVFNWPQAWKVWRQRMTSGLSASSLWMLFVVQAGFTVHGWCLRDTFLSISGSIASCTTAFIIVGYYSFRSK